MKREKFSDITAVELSCQKSVFIRSWDDPFVEIRYPENKECLVGENTGLLSINAKSYLILSVPNDMSISIDRINGNLEVVGYQKSMDIANISGNCSIQSIDALTAENISGNCKISSVKNDATIRNVSGNFSIGTTEGSLNVGGVGGNFSGNAEIIKLLTTVGGNIKIRANSIQGTESQLRAGGNIKLYIQDISDSTIEARAGGLVMYEKDEQSEKYRNGKFNITNGSGNKKLVLKAGGNIKISDQYEDVEIPETFGSVDDDYVDQVEQKFEARARQTSGFDFSDLFDIEGEIGDRIREKTKLADEKIQRAMEKMERKFSFREEFGDIPRPPKPPSPPSGPEYKTSQKTSSVTQEERLMVLKMLQDKIISAEEADRLLRALG